MIIDFHTHVYPKEIAAKFISFMERTSATQPLIPGSYMKAKTDGTLEGLKMSMKEAEIDYSVVLPVVTKPLQFESINMNAAKINGEEGIISFGSIHPNTKNYKSELEQIKALGLAGIKLHPDYQETFVDDSKIINIANYAAKLGLIVVFHTGKATGFTIAHCTPKRVHNLIKAADCSKVVVAHTGGYLCWDEAEEYIVGQNILLDVSYSLGQMEDTQFKRIIKNHGINKILFGTDSPWGGQKETLEGIKGIGLTKKELDQILYENAAKLLKLI